MGNLNSRSNEPGFFKSFVLPAFWIFVIPAISLAFFLHARSKIDEQIRTSALHQLNADQNMAAEEKEELRKFWNVVPVSRLVADPRMNDAFNAETKSTYFQFRWLIRLALLSIAVSLLTLMGVGMCVLFSLKSQRVQYYSLLVSWYGLRPVGIFLTIAQGLMLFGLSYWVTAIWFNVISIKLVFVAGLLCLAAVGTVLMAFFKRIPNECKVDGFPIDSSLAKQLWGRLKLICDSLGTNPPDQVIAGIDNNFFVTEQAVTANNKTFKGRTLFVSLPLLKQLSGSEADAVLAHEMAHFSGNDTLYSRKISPLLARYGNYLVALRAGGTTLPVYYFMNCFRALFELSLAKHGKAREFRADKLASEIASPNDLASALLKTIAYSNYRNKIQNELFQKQEELSDLNIAQRIETGFHDFASTFSTEKNLGELQTSHPFDSHPAISARCEAIGIPIEPLKAAAMLTKPSDGKWYYEIDRAQELEQAQWDEFEESFQKFHEQTLPYRFLPSSDQEKEIVLRYFPDRQFEGKQGVLTVDFEKVFLATWESPIFFRDVTNCTINEGVLYLQHNENGAKKKTNIKSSAFKKQAGEMLGIFQAYYQRHASAAAHQKALANANVETAE